MNLRHRVISSDISTGTYDEFIQYLLEFAKSKYSRYVCICNVHMIIEAYQHSEFSHIVNNADLTTPDGMPLAKAIKWLYGIKQDRVAGMDLMPDLMRECARQNLSIYLYGSTDEILARIQEKAAIDFPGITICGAYSPLFRELEASEKDEIIERINAADPHFIFVALGCPKQEKWMAEHRGRINSCMIGLGGAFEVYAEVKNRAPVWMQKSALEWFYRLIQDPKRLWKRYLITNTLFVWLLLCQWVKIRLFKVYN